MSLVGARLTLRVPSRCEAVRCLAGGAEFDFAEGYPSAFVVQLFRLLAEYPADLPDPGASLGPWVASRRADDLVLGAVSASVVWETGPSVGGLTEGSEDSVRGTGARLAGGPEGGSAVGPAIGDAVTVGYDVAPTCEGQGYATEILRLVCGHLLAQPGIVRVCADTEAGHAASRRVMEKAGLSWRRDATEELDGRQTTVVHYALDRVVGYVQPAS